MTYEELCDLVFRYEAGHSGLTTNDVKIAVLEYGKAEYRAGYLDADNGEDPRDE